MTDTALADALGQLPAVSLEEIERTASLQTRRDRKYVVEKGRLPAFLHELADDATVLSIDERRTFRYESRYFDTDALQSYLDAARSRPCRHKVRVRTYLDAGVVALEVKVRDRRGQTVKHRTPYDAASAERLSAEGCRFVDEVTAGPPAAALLRPTLTTRYQRSTLLIGESTSRVTIDTDFRGLLPAGESMGLDGYALIETKSSRGPTLADRVLWADHHRPVKISKYCVALAVLRPELAANKWDRVLRRYFDRRPRDRTAS